LSSTSVSAYLAFSLATKKKNITSFFNLFSLLTLNKLECFSRAIFTTDCHSCPFIRLAYFASQSVTKEKKSFNHCLLVFYDIQGMVGKMATVLENLAAIS